MTDRNQQQTDGDSFCPQRNLKILGGHTNHATACEIRMKVVCLLLGEGQILQLGERVLLFWNRANRIDEALRIPAEDQPQV